MQNQKNKEKDEVIESINLPEAKILKSNINGGNKLAYLNNKNNLTKYKNMHSFLSSITKKVEPEEIIESAMNYFSAMDGQTLNSSRNGKSITVVKPLTMEGLCTEIGITLDTFYKYANSKDERYRNICRYLMQIVSQQHIENGLIGEYNSRLTEFMLKNIQRDHYKDRNVDSEHAVPSKIDIIVNVKRDDGRIENINVKDGILTDQEKVIDTEAIEVENEKE